MVTNRSVYTLSSGLSGKAKHDIISQKATDRILQGLLRLL